MARRSSCRETYDLIKFLSLLMKREGLGQSNIRIAQAYLVLHQSSSGFAALFVLRIRTGTFPRRCVRGKRTWHWSILLCCNRLAGDLKVCLCLYKYHTAFTTSSWVFWRPVASGVAFGYLQALCKVCLLVILLMHCSTCNRRLLLHHYLF